MTFRTLLVSAVGLAACGACAADDGFTVLQAEGRVTVVECGQPVLAYQQQSTELEGQFRRAHYVHPLHALDGSVLTEDFPPDHRHHRGIFWAWHQVLVGDRHAGDAWLCRDFDWDARVDSVDVNSERAAIRATAIWRSSTITNDAGEPIPIVEDRVRLTVHLAQENYRSIDFDIALKALQPDVHIGGSDDAKGYGGFSPRIELKRSYTFFSPDGEIEPQTTAVTARGWVTIADANSGMAIIAHQDNPRPNDEWILRKAGSMQNAVYPGRVPKTLSQDEPLRLRYRVIVFHKLAAESIRELVESELSEFTDTSVDDK